MLGWRKSGSTLLAADQDSKLDVVGVGNTETCGGQSYSCMGSSWAALGQCLGAVLKASNTTSYFH